MLTYEFDDKTLAVDIPALTKQQSKVVLLKSLGKSNEAAGLILGIKESTVAEHAGEAYKRTGVAGADNPIALLQTKAFVNNWIRVLMMVVSLLPVTNKMNKAKGRKTPAVVQQVIKQQFKPITLRAA